MEHEVRDIDRDVDEIIVLLRDIKRILYVGFQNLGEDMSALDDQVAAMETAVQNQTTVEGGVTTLLTQLTDLIKSQGGGAANPKLQAVLDTLTKNNADLAAAVVANTPAAPPAPAPAP